MFFKKKSKLQPKLEEALRLVKHSTFLAAPYLYEKDYQPTEAEIMLLQKLQEACRQADVFTGHIVCSLQAKMAHPNMDSC